MVIVLGDDSKRVRSCLTLPLMELPADSNGLYHFFTDELRSKGDDDDLRYDVDFDDDLGFWYADAWIVTARLRIDFGPVLVSRNSDMVLVGIIGDSSPAPVVGDSKTGRFQRSKRL